MAAPAPHSGHRRRGRACYRGRILCMAAGCSLHRVTPGSNSWFPIWMRVSASLLRGQTGQAERQSPLAMPGLLTPSDAVLPALAHHRQTSLRRPASGKLQAAPATTWGLLRKGLCRWTRPACHFDLRVRGRSRFAACSARVAMRAPSDGTTLTCCQRMQRKTSWPGRGAESSMTQVCGEPLGGTPLCCDAWWIQGWFA